jgi:hypothetical protein
VPELAAIRRVLAAIFLFGSLGTGCELILLEHTEGVWQNVPLALLGVGCLALGVLAIRPAIAGLRIFQLTMCLFVASGVAGVWLHYQGNVAFELELNAEAAGWALFWESLKGATPSLAPGTMALLGTLGLAYTYRHPAYRTAPERHTNRKEARG